MKKILLFILFAAICYGQPGSGYKIIRWKDLSNAVKDSIRSGSTSIDTNTIINIVGPYWRSDISDSIAGIGAQELNYKMWTVVAKSGGKFNTIQAAINSFGAMKVDSQAVVEIMPGTYNETITLINYCNLLFHSGAKLKFVSASSNSLVNLLSHDTLAIYGGEFERYVPSGYDVNVFNLVDNSKLTVYNSVLSLQQANGNDSCFHFLLNNSKTKTYNTEDIMIGSGIGGVRLIGDSEMIFNRPEGCYPVYNINDYGAIEGSIGSAATNAVILNSLIDLVASGTEKASILIPKGTYYYSASLVIDKSSIVITGVNDSISVLKYTGSGNAIEINITPPDYILGYTIKDLHISGTSSATSIIKISDAVSSVGDGFIESVRMDSAAYGIWIAGVSWCNIFNRISMRFFTTCALYINGTSNLNLFTNSRFQESGTGVLTNVGEVRTLKFLNCSFQDNTLSVWLKYGYDISFDNCWFEQLSGVGASIDLGVNATPYLHNINVENCQFISGDQGIRLVGAVDGFKAKNNNVKNLDYIFVKILYAAMESEIEVSGTRSTTENDYFVQTTNSSGYGESYKGDYFSMNRNFVVDLSDTLWLWNGEYEGDRTPVTVKDDTVEVGGVLRPDQLLVSKGDSTDAVPLYNSWYRQDSLFYELENGDIIFVGKKVGTTLTESTINAKIVAFYDLDDDGSWADSVGNLDLTDNNGDVTNTTGIYGDCANFSGLSNVWLDHADDDTFSFGDVSMGVFAWVKLQYYISCGVVNKDGVSSGTRDWGLGFDYSGGDHFFFSRGKSSGDTTVDIVYTPWIPSYVKWYLLFGWYDEAKGYLFIRGFDQYNPISLDSVLVTGTPYDSGQEFQIGSRLSAEFTGKIDEVGILNAAPTEQEMLDVWNSGKGRKFPYWTR